MTTQSWSTRVRHDSDATFREWGSEFAAKMLACGLVQTADTGQINWTTVTRAGTNSNAGYEIWTFNDAQQSTAPIYFRVDYGTGGGTTIPRIQITTGTGSNGSGTITGTALSTAKSVHGNGAQTSDTARQSYMCATEGFFGFNWKIGSSVTEAAFCIVRTCDSNGSPTATGAIVHWGSGSAGSFTARQAFRYAATAAAYTAQTSTAEAAFGINPQSPGSTAVSGDIQVAIGFTITPRAEPLIGVCGVLATEVTPGSTFTATLVGVTSHTYLAWTSVGGSFTPVSSSSTGGMVIAMLWE